MVLLWLVTLWVKAQTVELTNLEYFKEADNTITIKAVIQDQEEEEGIAGLTVDLLSVKDTTTQKLGSVQSGEGGSVLFEKVSFDRVLLDSAHGFKLKLYFAGNDASQPAENSISFKDTQLELTFEEVDSVKMMVVKVKYWNESGELVPFPEAEVYFYARRLFSLLPIGEAYTADDGTDMVKFPIDLPGHNGGLIKVVARIEDSDEFGNVRVADEIAWGTAISEESEDLPRALWSTKTPLWMLITFVILMVAVWGHYGWIVYSLYQIKKSSGHTET